jgi:hypothetical protein
MNLGGVSACLSGFLRPSGTFAIGIEAGLLGLTSAVWQPSQASRQNILPVYILG